MSRIRMVLMAIVAVVAIGAAGAGTASAATNGSGTITVGAGSCNVTFDTTAWSGSGTSWSADLDNFDVSGSGCLVFGEDGSGTLTKRSDGTATLDIDLSFYVPLFEYCSYSGSLAGTWYWTEHLGTTKVGTGPNGSQPPGEDKYFVFEEQDIAKNGAGTTLCPNPARASGAFWTHEHS